MARNIKKNEASSSASGSRSSTRSESVVSDVGKCKSSCGYCKSGAPTSVSHGLRTRSHQPSRPPKKERSQRDLVFFGRSSR